MIIIVTGELQLHLQSLVNLLRDEDVLRLVGEKHYLLQMWHFPFQITSV